MSIFNWKPISRWKFNWKSVFVMITGTLLASVCTAETVTYEFTAKITDNGGVEYFAKGTEITGSFTYDKDARAVPVPSRVDGAAYYPSSKNNLFLNYRGQQFIGKGKYLVGVLSLTAEGFSFRACDMQLPSGWKIDHSSKADTYGLILQNSRARGVIVKAKRPPLPATLDLDQFDTTEVRLNFGDGVKYPQGRVDSRALVRAKVISLKTSGDKRVTDQSK